MTSPRSSTDFNQNPVMESKLPLLQAQASEGASTSSQSSPFSSIIRQTPLVVVSMVIGGLFINWALACIGVWQLLANQTQTVPMLWSSASPPAIVPATILNPPVKTLVGDCGKTPQEAKALGCEFDIMMTAWTHPKCIDRELSNRYVREGGVDSQGWKFYVDKAGTREIPLDEVMKGEYVAIWSSWGFHMAHCGYLWNNVQREQLTKPLGQRVLNEDAWDVGHISHCIKFSSFPNVSHILDSDAILPNHVLNCLRA